MSAGQEANSDSIFRIFSEDDGSDIPLGPLTPELNPSAQRCLTRIFTGDLAS
jgi:hypothetical protein